MRAKRRSEVKTRNAIAAHARAPRGHALIEPSIHSPAVAAHCIALVQATAARCTSQHLWLRVLR